MCNKRNSELIMTAYEGDFKVDKCIKRKILSLRKQFRSEYRKSKLFYKTMSCCCGHGKYPKTIVVKLPNDTRIEWFTNILIPRKRRFYKKDKKGFYYIPEVLK